MLGCTLTELASIHVIAVLVMMVMATNPMPKRSDIDNREQCSYDDIEVDIYIENLDVPEVAFVAHVMQLDERTYTN